MFYLILRKRVWVGMMLLKSSWSEPSQTDLSKASSRRQGGSAANFLFALTCIQQLICPWWSFSRKILFFCVTLKYQSIVSSTPPPLLTKEDRKVVTHMHAPLFLCSMLNCVTCLIFAMETKMQITIKLWYLGEYGISWVAKKWWTAQNSRLHLFLMFSNDRFLCLNGQLKLAETSIVIQYVPYHFVHFECKQGHFVLFKIGY